MDTSLVQIPTYSILGYALLVGKGKVSYILSIYIWNKKAIQVLLINRYCAVLDDRAKNGDGVANVDDDHFWIVDNWLHLGGTDGLR